MQKKLGTLYKKTLYSVQHMYGCIKCKYVHMYVDIETGNVMI